MDLKKTEKSVKGREKEKKRQPKEERKSHRQVFFFCFFCHFSSFLFVRNLFSSICFHNVSYIFLQWWYSEGEKEERRKEAGEVLWRRQESSEVWNAIGLSLFQQVCTFRQVFIFIFDVYFAALLLRRRKPSVRCLRSQRCH